MDERQLALLNGLGWTFIDSTTGWRAPDGRESWSLPRTDDMNAALEFFNKARDPSWWLEIWDDSVEIMGLGPPDCNGIRGDDESVASKRHDNAPASIATALIDAVIAAKGNEDE